MSEDLKVFSFVRPVHVRAMCSLVYFADAHLIVPLDAVREVLYAVCGYGPDIENVAVRHAILEGRLECGACITTVAPDTVVVANCGASELLVVQVSTGTVERTIHGTRYPVGVALVDDGIIVVGDLGNHRVAVIRWATGEIIRTVGSEGAGDGQFVSPYGVGALGGPLIGVCDGERNCLQIIRWDGNDGGKFEKSIPVDFPRDVVAVDENTLAVSLLNKNEVRVIRWRGVDDSIFVPLRTIRDLNNPYGLCVVSPSIICIADSKGHRLLFVQWENGTTVRSVGTHGSGPGKLNCPTGVTVVDTRIVVVDQDNRRIVIVH